MTGWILLYSAIIFEVIGTSMLKLSEGFSKTGTGITAIILFVFSLILFTYALKYIPVSISYAIWSGVGTLAIAIIGIFWFEEEIGILKTFFLVMIIAGCAGLNLITKTGA